MLFRQKKYINWEEFMVLDSETQTWTFINNDPEDALKDMGAKA